MCKIKLICKKDSEVISDNQVCISGKEFEILDKPYYVVKSEIDAQVDFIFHYIDTNEDRRIINNEYFRLTFGWATGRLYAFTIKSIEHVANELWENFNSDYIQKEVFNSDLAKNNLKIGYGVVKKIYFNKIEILE